MDTTAVNGNFYRYMVFAGDVENARYAYTPNVNNIADVVPANTQSQTDPNDQMIEAIPWRIGPTSDTTAPGNITDLLIDPAPTAASSFVVNWTMNAATPDPVIILRDTINGAVNDAPADATPYSVGELIAMRKWLQLSLPQYKAPIPGILRVEYDFPLYCLHTRSIRMMAYRLIRR